MSLRHVLTIEKACDCERHGQQCETHRYTAWRSVITSKSYSSCWPPTSVAPACQVTDPPDRHLRSSHIWCCKKSYRYVAASLYQAIKVCWRATNVRDIEIVISVGITHTPGGARPPNRLTAPPPKKGVKFEHLGAANKSRNKCIISARRRSASEDYLFRALQIYSLLLLLLLF